jgi:VanZ family protein
MLLIQWRENVKNKSLILSIAMLCLLVLVINFLSFQNGTQTTNVSKGMAKVFLGTFDIEATAANMKLFINISRMIARIVLFFLLGLLAVCVASELAFPNDILRYALCVAFCALVAFETEWFKLFIAGRHCSLLDMGISFVSALAGVLAYTCAVWVKGRL